MPILRQVLGKIPSSSKARVRNFIANRELGTQSDIHENVISPGVVVPWHYHETEEVIVVLEGAGECRTEQGIENYSAGDVIILPARVKRELRYQVDTADLLFPERSRYYVFGGRLSGPDGRRFQSE
jgi:quercetin dioxygenase-like cupin family protein